jgi:hypothetical protein
MSRRRGFTLPPRRPAQAKSRLGPARKVAVDQLLAGVELRPAAKARRSNPGARIVVSGAVALAAESPPGIPLAPRKRLSPRLPRLVRASSAFGGCMGFGWRLAAGPVTATVLRHAGDDERGLRGFAMATPHRTGIRESRAQRWLGGRRCPHMPGSGGESSARLLHRWQPGLGLGQRPRANVDARGLGGNCDLLPGSRVSAGAFLLRRLDPDGQLDKTAKRGPFARCRAPRG